MQHQTYTLFKFSNQELYWPIKIIGNQMLLSCTCSTSLLQCQTRMHTPSPRELILRVLCKILETFGVVIYKRYQLQRRKVIREQHYCSPWAKSSGAHYSVFLKKKKLDMVIGSTDWLKHETLLKKPIPSQMHFL